MLSSSAAPNTTTVLRLLGNMVTNDCNDGQAMQCGLVHAMLCVLQGERTDATAKCLALRILASLSSSPVFDSVFCSSGMIQVSHCQPRAHSHATPISHCRPRAGAVPAVFGGREGGLPVGRSRTAQHEYTQRVSLPLLLLHFTL
jgi:hypothetical protein